MSSVSQIHCVRKLHFCAGHRVMGHENKCRTPHGHNYNVFIHATADQLDGIGRVIDFSVLKEKIGQWIEIHWDHTFLIFEDDREMIDAFASMPHNKEAFICPFNPTAENIADYLLRVVSPQVLEGTGVLVTKVVLHETENCYAEVNLKEKEPCTK